MLGAFFNTGISALSLFLYVFSFSSPIYLRALKSTCPISARNAGVMERYFEAMVHTRLLNTIARLDYTAANSPENIKLLGEAASTIEVGASTAFCVRDPAEEHWYRFSTSLHHHRRCSKGLYERFGRGVSSYPASQNYQPSQYGSYRY